MDYVYSLLILVGLVLGIWVADEMLRAYPIAFFILWIAIPIFAVLFKRSKYRESLSKESSKWIRIISISLAIGVSFFIFCEFDNISDEFGYESIKGYQSDRYQDFDGYGRPVTEFTTYTSHWSGGIVLWVFEIIYVVFCFAIPIFTWKQWQG